MQNLLRRWIQGLFYWFRPETARDGELKRHLDEIEAIVGVPFGSHVEFMECGRSNRHIAGEMVYVRNLSLRTDLPLIAQWEIVDCLAGRGEPVFSTEAPRYGPHVNTRLFFEQLRSAFPKMQKIAIVAHPAHALRCAMVAERLGFEVGVLWTAAIDYDPASTQRWCRSPWLFIPWEFASRVLFLIRGWM